MKHEDWVRYQSQIEVEWLEKFGPRPKTHAEAIAELRVKVLHLYECADKHG